jgi:hypothetical protein
MNFKEVNLTICIGCGILLLPIGYSIRSYFDNQQYFQLIISISLAIILLLISRKTWTIANTYIELEPQSIYISS